eukprot:1103089-Pelagomonas_calceolata.AAC.3
MGSPPGLLYHPKAPSLEGLKVWECKCRRRHLFASTKLTLLADTACNPFQSFGAQAQYCSTSTPTCFILASMSSATYFWGDQVAKAVQVSHSHTAQCISDGAFEDIALHSAVL